MIHDLQPSGSTPEHFISVVAGRSGMPQYKYRARDKEGVLQTGTMEARGREAVADQLSRQGVIPVQIEEQAQPLLRPDLFEGFTRVKPQDLIIFSRQLATLMSA